jgi:purine nucleoside permease
MSKTCARCGLAEKRGKVFETVASGDSTFHLCVDCAQIAYKIKDAVTLGDTSSAAALGKRFQEGIVAGPAKPAVDQWFCEYKTRLGI